MHVKLTIFTHVCHKNKQKITQNKKEKQTSGCLQQPPQVDPHKSREGQVNERGARRRGDR